VQLIVTDATGAMDGPFQLGMTRRCPQVPNSVPPVKHGGRRAKRARASADATSHRTRLVRAGERRCKQTLRKEQR
jgi:hypothetical protein